MSQIEDFHTGDSRTKQVRHPNKKDVLVVNFRTVEVLAAFAPHFRIVTEGQAMTRYHVGKVFSAVTPDLKRRAWWNELQGRAEDGRIHWLQ